MKITPEFLEAFEACEPQAKKALEVFPGGFEPTVENLTILRCTTYTSPRNGLDHVFLDVPWLGDQLEWLNLRVHQRYITLYRQTLKRLGRLQDKDPDLFWALAEEFDIAAISAMLLSITEDEVRDAIERRRQEEQEEEEELEEDY